jgi:23S rRNA (adenine2030-N6)-methyltransferase
VLSYQHDYHAGNHADVLKHSVLAILIRALQRKPAALRIIDSHAGSGVYDLHGELAQRGQEFQHGVMRLLAAPPALAGSGAPPSLAPYFEALTAQNPDGNLRYYPGSPQLALTLLREQDRLELFELHPQASAALRAHFHRKPNVHVHHRDGFEGLVAVVPPRERRGIAVIDPSYEHKSDYLRVVETLAAAIRRWANGVFMVWYPLIRQPGSGQLIARLKQLKLPRAFQVELEPAPAAARMRGSGVVIVNLPFQLDPELERLLPWLLRCLCTNGTGASRARWLG